MSGAHSSLHRYLHLWGYCSRTVLRGISSCMSDQCQVDSNPRDQTFFLINRRSTSMNSAMHAGASTRPSWRPFTAAAPWPQRELSVRRDSACTSFAPLRLVETPLAHCWSPSVARAGSSRAVSGLHTFGLAAQAQPPAATIRSTAALSSGAMCCWQRRWCLAPGHLVCSQHQRKRK